MIIGLGTDIIEIKRIEKATMRTKSFIDKVLTKEEQKALLGSKNDCQRIAANFAAKEAVSKALGTGFRGFGLLDIEVFRNELGKPYVKLHHQAKALATNLGVDQVSISLSHCEAYAVAMVIVEGSDKGEGCN